MAPHQPSEATSLAGLAQPTATEEDFDDTIGDITADWRRAPSTQTELTFRKRTVMMKILTLNLTIRSESMHTMVA